MQRRLTFERLEPREMLSSTSWIGGHSIYWSDALNWSNGVPTSSLDAVISPTSAATITIQPGETDAANSLTLGSNAALSILTTSDPSLPTSNLLANAGFESPAATNGTTAPSSWGPSGSAYLSTQYAYSGAQSLVLSGNGSSVSQTFNATPDTSYTVSVYAMTPASNPLSGSLDAQVAVWFFDSNWDWLGFGIYYTTIMSSSTAPGGPLAGSVGNQGWNRYFLTSSASPSNAAHVTVQLQVNASSSYGGAAYFDDVQFGPAAAGPSTLTLGSSSSPGFLDNSGSIAIGPTNQINVNGSFTQGSTGTLDVQLNGGPQEAGAVATDMLGSLAVTGTAALAGTLQASLVYGYTPATTDTFTPITFASYTGGFTSTSLPSGSGYQLESATSFTNVVVSAAPSASVTTTVSAGTILHTVATGLSGVNLTLWDGTAVSSQTQQLTAAAGLDLFRFPGGSASDLLHFDQIPNSWELNFANFVEGIAASGGSGMATLDYGSASPQEDAAEVAYLLGSTTDTAPLGEGLQWETDGNNGSGAWEWVNWQTVSYWASLRGASPLAVDDGFNFLRIDHPAPFSTIKYYEVGNEVSGSWEPDYHGTPGPGGISTGAAHDAATYAAFCCQFVALAQPIVAAAGLPPISIGIIAGDVTQSSPDSWTTTVLTACKNIGFVPGFLIDHNYAGGDDDYYLLNETMSDPYSVFDWSVRYNNLESQLQDYFGSQASSVQIMATEFNSTSGSTGKETTSLVNGLFLADSLGSLIDSNYAAATVWDLRNGNVTDADNSNSLYGWREYGDYGLLDGYVTYPTYFAEELASKLIVAGGQVVSAASNYGELDVYAVRESNSHLELLVINKNPAAAITSQFDVTGFQPTGSYQAWQYGKAEDLAQSQSSTGAASLTNTTGTLSLSGANFSYTFPSYSMTVIDLAPSQTLTSIAISPATARLASNKTQQFTATALDQYGNPMATQPTFTWTLASGVGGVSSSGLYTAPAMTGTASVKAAYGGLSGTASVTVTNASPTVATAAAASPGTVTASTAALSVLGADGGGQSSLTYTWSVLSEPTGATVMFSANGTNAAQDATATFDEAGVYNLEATITNLAGLTVASPISVTVSQTLSSVAVTPGNLTLAANSHEQFTATGYDQFGIAMTTQPSFAWSTSNTYLGSISTSGLYTTGSLQGTTTITATTGTLSATAAIDVTSLPAPVAWYRFNEGGGYTALDSSGNGLNGVINYSGVNYGTTAPTGADLVLDGSSGNVNVGEPSGLNITGQITLSAWVDPDYSSPPSGDFDIVGRGYTSNAETELRIENGDFEAGSWNGSANYYAYYAIPTADLNTWSLLTGVYDGSTWRLYLNGQPVGTTVTTTVGSLAVSMDWMIGSSGDGNRYFDGGIGDVRIYNVGLSAAQVAQLYDSYYPPTVATAAAANPTTVTAKTTALSALGSSSVSLPLTYTWSSSGPAAVTFSPNGTGAAQNATVTFSEVGTYTLSATIADSYGQFATSSVTVTVNQTFTSIGVSPSAPGMVPNGTQQFSATAYDQFGNAMVTQPSFTWGTTIGTISSGGLLTAPSGNGSGAVTATAGGVNGTAAVTVTDPAPTVATPAAASPGTVTATTAILSVLGQDDEGQSVLTYTWATTGTPPAAVSYSANGTNAAQSTTATFAKAGTYNFTVTIKNVNTALTATSSVTVTVNQTLTSIAVALAANNLATTGAEQYAATAYDQFGQAMATQPAFTWSVTGGGTIDSNGNYQPPYTTGSAVISAAVGGLSGQATATYPGLAQWNIAGGGSWSGGSWIGTTSMTTVSPPGIRGLTGDYAQFSTSGGTISLSGVDPSLAGISFTSSSSYTLSGGAVTLANGANPATIAVTAGNHTIATPVTLQSNLNVTVLAGGFLTLSGASGAGKSLTFTGPGKLTLGGNNTFSGGATVLSGTLVVSEPGAVPSGSNLAIGANLGLFK